MSRRPLGGAHFGKRLGSNIWSPKTSSPTCTSPGTCLQYVLSHLAYLKGCLRVTFPKLSCIKTTD